MKHINSEMITTQKTTKRRTLKIRSGTSHKINPDFLIKRIRGKPVVANSIPFWFATPFQNTPGHHRNTKIIRKAQSVGNHTFKNKVTKLTLCHKDLLLRHQTAYAKSVTSLLCIYTSHEFVVHPKYIIYWSNKYKFVIYIFLLIENLWISQPYRQHIRTPHN